MIQDVVMKKPGRIRAKTKNDSQARVKIAKTELAVLLENVKRDRDRLAANSLTLKFVWQQAEHPCPGKLWEPNFRNHCNHEWRDAGHFLCKITLPTNMDPPLDDCRIYLVRGDSKVIERFTEHCREAEAILGRMVGDGTRFNWAKELIENFRDAFDDEDRDVVDWREDDGDDRPEAWSLIAEISDVFDWTRILLMMFLDGAEREPPSQTDSMLHNERHLNPAPTVENPDGGKSDEAKFAFKPDGDGYFVRGFGEQGHITAKGAKGLHDIFRLVQSPRVPVPMRELVVEAGTKQLDGDPHSRQPVANNMTRQNIIAERMRFLADIEKADNDLKRDELRAELETLETGAIKLYGLAGKPRDLNNQNDRLRPSLLARKSRACKQLEISGLTTLAEHLDLSIVSEGACLVYRPTIPNISWDTEREV